MTRFRRSRTDSTALRRSLKSVVALTLDENDCSANVMKTPNSVERVPVRLDGEPLRSEIQRDCLFLDVSKLAVDSTIVERCQR